MVCWHNTGEAEKLKQKSIQGKKDRADSQSHDKEPASAKQRQEKSQHKGKRLILQGPQEI